jgi:hypothetical protein
MNFRLLATTIIALLALTSCGNSGGNSSKYDEVELIEYESCLSAESEQWNLALTQGNIQRDLRPGGKFWIESENRAYQVEEFALSMCEKYRPKPIK